VTDTVLEFLIRRTDPEGSWFDLKFNDMTSVLRPRSVASEVITGDGELRLRVGDAEVEINFEDPGLAIAFSGPVDPLLARRIVDELAESLAQHTGQRGRVVEL
jgi:hypothetical protein